MIETTRSLRHALRKVAKQCPHMARAIDQRGFPDPRSRAPGFGTLMQAIISQQVSKEAGNAIWNKLETRLEDVTPDKVCRYARRHCEVAACRARKCATQRRWPLRSDPVIWISMAWIE